MSRLSVAWCISLAIGACSVVGCGARAPVVNEQAPPATPPTQDLGALEGRHLTFESAEGFIPVPGHQFGMSFGHGRMGSSADCNHHSRGAALDGDRLVITGGGMSTEMGCPRSLQAQGDWFAMFLKSKPRVSFDGPRVRFTGYGATLVFLDYKVMYPDLPLVGTAWATNGAISHGMVGMRPGRHTDTTLAFHDDATINVSTPCSTAFGHYTADAETLTLTDIVYTESSCAELHGDDVHMRAVITDGTVSYEIDSSRLMLLRDIGEADPIGWFAYPLRSESEEP